MDKRSLLTEFLGTPIKQGDEFLFECPRCNNNKKKLSINIKKNVFKCWVCEYSGRSLYRIIKAYAPDHIRSRWKEHISYDLSKEFGELLNGKQKEDFSPPLVLPKEFKSLLNKDDSYMAQRANEYLKDRGLDEYDYYRYKPGYCGSGRHKGMVLFPSFDINGKLNYYVARTFLGGFPKYDNPQASKDIVFNELFVNWDQDVVLVEGVFDAIKAGDNSIPLLGSYLNYKKKLFKQCVSYDPKIYLAMDPDAETKELSVAKELLEYNLRVFKIPVKPFKDVGEMTKCEFMRRKDMAEEYRVEDFYFHKVKSILEGVL